MLRVSRDYCSNSRMRQVTVHGVLQSTAKAALATLDFTLIIILKRFDFHVKIKYDNVTHEINLYKNNNIRQKKMHKNNYYTKG